MLAEAQRAELRNGRKQRTWQGCLLQLSNGMNEEGSGNN